MRGFVALMRKEARDIRALTWASMALAAVAAVVVRWVLGQLAAEGRTSALEPPWVEPFVPACVVLYAVMAAADVVGGEVAARRSDLWALLPASGFRVWCAKATALIGATALFAAWCLLVQMQTILQTDGTASLERFVERAQSNVWVAGPVATFLFATLLASTFRLRGLGAAFVGAAMAAAACVGAEAVASWLGYGRVWYASGSVATERIAGLASAAIVAPALLIAAALAFTFGRVHLGRVLRPLAIGLAAFAALCAPPTALWAQSAFAVVPGAPGVSLEWAIPDPSGRYVAAVFVNYASSTPHARTFVLDVETADLREVDARDARPSGRDGATCWDADGSLVLHASSFGLDELRADPATGEVRSRRKCSSDDLHTQSVLNMRAWHERMPWVVESSTTPHDGFARYRTLFRRNGSRVKEAPVELRSWLTPHLGLRGRVFYYPEPEVLATCTLPDREERRLLVNDEPWRSGWIGGVSPDGGALIVRHRGVWRVLDLATLATTDLPASAGPPSWVPVRGDDERRLVCLRRVSSAPASPGFVDVIDLATGAARLFNANDQYATFHSVGGDRIIIQSGNRIDVASRDLTTITNLWPTGKAVR